MKSIFPIIFVIFLALGAAIAMPDFALAAPAQCNDGIDNDGDGLTDSADPGCHSLYDDSEYNAPTGGNFLAACNDGIDNDGDGKIDLADDGCFAKTDNSETHFDIDPNNKPPVWRAIGTRLAKQNQNLSLTVLASDPNGDTLTYEAVDLPSGAHFTPSTRTFSWTPNSSQLGFYNVRLRVSDNVNLPVETVFVVQVASGGTSTPTKPSSSRIYFTTVPPSTAIANTLYTYEAKAIDPDGYALRYEVMTAPAGTFINAQFGGLTWSPTLADVGKTFSFTIRAMNPAGKYATQSFKVKVQGPVLGTSTDFPNFPNTGAGGSRVWLLLLPMLLVSVLAMIGLVLLRRAHKF